MKPSIGAARKIATALGGPLVEVVIILASSLDFTIALRYENGSTLIGQLHLGKAFLGLNRA